jgi:hypothetical protein
LSGLSWWISDDGEAVRYAKFQNITREMIDIFSIAVADDDTDAAEAFGLMNQMAARGRHQGSRSPLRTSDADRQALPRRPPGPTPAHGLDGREYGTTPGWTTAEPVALDTQRF